MPGLGRATRLILLVAFGACGLALRLFQIQVVEHDVWATEAVRLVSSGEVVPFTRGAITDVHGRVLHRDREAYHLVLTYRDFRRGHPLGQVAHARSALEMRPVPLAEAARELESWALELVALSPSDLDAFADGAPLTTPTLRLPARSDPGADQRRSRASDVRFYVGGLLGWTRREWRELRRARESSDALPSMAALTAAWRGESRPEVVVEELLERLDGALEHLELLAAELRPEVLGEGEGTPGERLVALLEERRRQVEDATAGRLFREAAGFAAGRVAPEILAESLDVTWISRRLHWDTERLVEWMLEARHTWVRSWRDHYAIPHLVAEARRQDAGPERMLDLLTALLAPPADLERALRGDPVPWRRASTLEVFGRLEDLFEAELPEGYDPERDAVVPYRGASLGERAFGRTDWGLLPAAAGADDAEAASTWARNVRRSSWSARNAIWERAVAVADAWDRFFQERLGEVLSATVEGAGPGELGPSGGLLFSEERLDRANERARFVRRDQGSRPLVLDERPGYEVVHLLTRYPEAYPGFRPKDARERLAVRLEDEEATPGALLLGSVTPLDPDEVQSQRLAAQRLGELLAKPTRTRDERDELARLVGEVSLRDEMRGAEGVEALMDPELRGRNGYKEHRGLEDVYGRGGRWEEVRRVTDGLDVRLTLDADVQRAAEWVIEHPYLPPEEPYRDVEWFTQPVGAIVVLTPEGDVVCAASAPNDLSKISEDARDQRQEVQDRSLRMPLFQPVGSVFKPFVALWALEYSGLDPTVRIACVPHDGKKAGYGDVRCWLSSGHGPDVDLRQALVGSCNSYFAWLGETFSGDDFRELCDHFGFGLPTGIRYGDRAGLYEDVPARFLDRRLTDLERRLSGNGLALIEATPMQVARATCALATGRLPSVRLVDEVGGEPVPVDSLSPLAISGAHLERVREHLRAVANDPDGTAFDALNAHTLGFTVAVKTGSADLPGVVPGTEADPKNFKHTWVAGWLPAEDPQAVFVVFLDRVRYTSSHTAVHVARQFLQRPEFATWLSAREGRRP